MASTIADNMPFLQLIAVAGNRQQMEMLLDTMSASQMKAICETVLNVRFGNIPLSPKDIKRLTRHKEAIRSISDIKASSSTRRQLILRESALISLILKLSIQHLKTLEHYV